MKYILYIILFTTLAYTTTAQLKLIHPNGGETLQAGRSTTVMWESTPNFNNFQIQTSYDNGRYWNLITDSANGNSYDWSVPYYDLDNCLLKIQHINLNEEWSVAIDTLKNYNTQQLINSNQGGYIIVENTWIIGSAPDDELKTDIRVIKTDDSGNQVWSEYYGGLNGDEIANAAIEDEDGNIYIIGLTNSTDFGFELKGGNDLLLIKLNPDGQLIWKKNYGGSKPDLGFDIISDKKGNFILGGYTLSDDGDVNSSPQWADYWIIKINAEGDIIWEKTYGRERDELLRKIRLGHNNEIVILGSSDSRDSVYISTKYHNYINKVHPWIVKLDSIGNIIWDYQYERAEDSAYDFIIQNDGSILTVGYSVKPTGTNPERFHWVLILDSQGKVIKVKDLSPQPEEYVKEFLVSKEGSIYYISNVYKSYRITNINPDGDIIWFKNHANMKGINSFVESDDGGLVLTGVREQKRDFFESMLIKLSIEDSFYSVTSDVFSIKKNTTSVINTDNDINFMVSPNIVTSTATATIELIENGETTLELYNSQGRKLETLLTGYQTIGMRDILIDVSQYTSGRYFIKLTTPSISKTELIEVQR